MRRGSSATSAARELRVAAGVFAERPEVFDRGCRDGAALPSDGASLVIEHVVVLARLAGGYDRQSERSRPEQQPISSAG